MKLIKLNYFTGDDSEWVEEIYINADNIICIRPKDWFSEVELSGSRYLKVEETVEEIQSLLDGKDTIKYSHQRRIGKKIQEIRRMAGMNLVEFGENCGIGIYAVMKWETGRSLPSAEKLAKIADLAGITVQYLLEG